LIFETKRKVIAPKKLTNKNFLIRRGRVCIGPIGVNVVKNEGAPMERSEGHRRRERDSRGMGYLLSPQSTGSLGSVVSFSTGTGDSAPAEKGFGAF